jgi:hypothetical protein
VSVFFFFFFFLSVFVWFAFPEFWHPKKLGVRPMQHDLSRAGILCSGNDIAHGIILGQWLGLALAGSARVDLISQAGARRSTGLAADWARPLFALRSLLLLFFSQRA